MVFHENNPFNYIDRKVRATSLAASGTRPRFPTFHRSLRSQRHCVRGNLYCPHRKLWKHQEKHLCARASMDTKSRVCVDSVYFRIFSWIFRLGLIYWAVCFVSVNEFRTYLLFSSAAVLLIVVLCCYDLVLLVWRAYWGKLIFGR